MHRVAGFFAFSIWFPRRFQTAQQGFLNMVARQVTPAPVFVSIPQLSTKPVGRETELMALWKGLLQGKRIQVVYGLDGLGKSTLVADFCAHAARYSRFTCINWFNSGQSLRYQFAEFVKEMKGRKENDVLIVFDNVISIDEVLPLIPQKANFYVVITMTAKPVVDTKAELPIQLHEISPLDAQCIEEFASLIQLTCDEEMKSLCKLLCHIPLLTRMALGLVSTGAVTTSRLLSYLSQDGITTSEGISLANTTAKLLQLCLDYAESKLPRTKQLLAALCCLDIVDLNPALISAATEGKITPEQLGEVLLPLAVLAQRWEDGAFSMHSSVATALQNVVDVQAGAEAAAKAVRSMWPKRWRGVGYSTASSLVAQTEALRLVWSSHALKFCDDFIECLDRAATFLAHVAGKKLHLAMIFWKTALRAVQNETPRTQRCARVAWECGRLCYAAKDRETEEILKVAYDTAGEVHRKLSSEQVLVLSFYALYLPETEETQHEIDEGIQVLSSRLDGTSGETLLKAEVRMVKESLFVLLMRKAAVMEALGKTVEQQMWDELQDLEKQLATDPKK